MKTSLPPPMIEVGKHYIVGERMRWVLAVANEHVIYSRGGDSHMECQIRTFLRWLKGEREPEKTEAQ